MKNKFLSLVFFFFTIVGFAQADHVSVVKNDKGMKLVVNGKDFMINGMNWDYIPIGTNTVNANFWEKSDDLIKAGLDAEMGLLKNMGVNVVRQYTGVQPKWIKYIYENYGIYTMLNHSFGRYGLTIDGVWTPVTDYSDNRTQEVLLSEVDKLVKDFSNTPGLLLYLLGNENNYGLFWAGAETEDFPDSEEEKKFIGEKRGRPMYRLMNEAAKKIKAMDSSHPVAICNGDVLFIDIVADECKDVDIYGVNSYRGVSFGDMFQVVKDKLNKPIMFTEFGADAFNAIENAEDQKSQAYYMVGNWKDIYENAAGLGKAENSIGGFTFQFSDGWWKYGFDDRENADVHDNNASWANGGYSIDLAPGENNMNEEWFGICAKGQTNERGLYELYPRAAYYALKEAHQLNPYEAGVTGEFVSNYFDNIQLMDAVLRARGDKAALVGEKNGKVRISDMRMELTTFNTGGSLISTPKEADPDKLTYPNQLGFDHMESYYFGVEAKPSESVRANVTFNVLGNVANNPIDEIFYENTGRSREVKTGDGTLLLEDINRVKVHNADFSWNSKYFNLTGFYRTGHYHWGYEGDFFGLYPEANYGANLDIYNGEVSGIEFEGKKELNGFKVAFGPQLWWGANPAVLVKYSKKLGHFNVTGIFHEDIDEQAAAVSSFAIPNRPTRRATLHLKTEVGKVGVELGGIWSGQPRVGETFQLTREEAEENTAVIDKVNSDDTWGGKLKLTYGSGPFKWYGQGAVMGLVANGGADYTQTYTGWRLKDSGSGNQYNVLSGFTYLIGKFEIAPNFLWQKPIVDAIPDDITGAGRKRNILDDPFAVINNRETVGAELLLTYDPTPGTWMYAWDNDRSEDANFAMNAGFVFRNHKGTRDSKIGFDDTGRIAIALPGGTPARDLWEAHTRIVSKINPEFGFIANLYAGNGEPNAYGSESQINRLIDRFGGDVRMIYKKVKLTSQVKINDWGPYDYHRDWNITYPLQLMADISTTVGKPDWFILPNTSIGARFTWRSLDQYSNRYNPTQTLDASGNLVPDPTAIGFGNGNEWEIRTYIHINLGK